MRLRRWLRHDLRSTHHKVGLCVQAYAMQAQIAQHLQQRRLHCEYSVASQRLGGHGRDVVVSTTSCSDSSTRGCCKMPPQHEATALCAVIVQGLTGASAKGVACCAAWAGVGAGMGDCIGVGSVTNCGAGAGAWGVGEVAGEGATCG